MAKSKRTISLADVPPGMTLVRSRTYGDHVRAKRGTYKKAKLNSALRKGAELVGEANAAAKLFKDAIDPWREGLVDRSLWTRLLSIFRRHQTMTGTVGFGQLKDLELHARYTLHKLLPVQAVFRYDHNTRRLRAVISWYGMPRFGKTEVDGYKLTAIFLFPNLKKKTARTAVKESAILSLEKRQAPFAATVSVPAAAKCFLLCLRIDGCSGNNVHYTMATKGMRVIAAGDLSRGNVSLMKQTS